MVKYKETHESKYRLYEHCCWNIVDMAVVAVLLHHGISLVCSYVQKMGVLSRRPLHLPNTSVASLLGC